MINEILHYIILSLIGSVALIVASKIILNKLLRRNTDYYEKIEASEEKKLIENIEICEHTNQDVVGKEATSEQYIVSERGV